MKSAAVLGTESSSLELQTTRPFFLLQKLHCKHYLMHTSNTYDTFGWGSNHHSIHFFISSIWITAGQKNSNKTVCCWNLPVCWIHNVPWRRFNFDEVPPEPCLPGSFQNLPGFPASHLPSSSAACLIGRKPNVKILKWSIKWNYFSLYSSNANKAGWKMSCSSSRCMLFSALKENLDFQGL